MKNFDNFHIRLIELNDTDAFFELVEKNRDRLKRFFPLTMKETADYRSCVNYVEDKIALAERKEMYVYMVILDGKIVGIYIVKNIDWRIPKCELAYFIDGEYEGKGVMSKALDLLLHQCFDVLKIHKIYICVAPQNESSRRLPIKKKFKLEGLHRQEFRLETGELVDIEYYGKLKGE